MKKKNTEPSGSEKEPSALEKAYDEAMQIIERAGGKISYLYIETLDHRVTHSKIMSYHVALAIREQAQREIDTFQEIESKNMREWYQKTFSRTA